MLALHRRRARAAAASAATRQPQPGTTELTGPAPIGLALLDNLAVLGPSIEFQAAGRYACAPSVSDVTEIVALEPCSAEHLRDLRAIHGDRVYVVVDRREVADRSVLTSCLGAGADACVSSGHVEVLVAHLDALVRRKWSNPSTVDQTGAARGERSARTPGRHTASVEV